MTAWTPAMFRDALDTDDTLEGRRRDNTAAARELASRCQARADDTSDTPCDAVGPHRLHTHTHPSGLRETWADIPAPVPALWGLVTGDHDDIEEYL